MGTGNKILARLLSNTPRPIVKKLSQPYIAGQTLDDAMEVVYRLNEQGTKLGKDPIRATIDHLGEEVKSRDEAVRRRDFAISILDEINRRKLDADLSLKLTTQGLRRGHDAQYDFCLENSLGVVDHAVSLGNKVEIDAEESWYTDNTHLMYKELRKMHPNNVMLCLQAMLHRTTGAEGKHSDLLRLGIGRYRLCKGIYLEDTRIGYRDKEKVREIYLEALELIIRNGCFIAIATHDDILVEQAEQLIAKGIPGGYEFQMLLGVRKPLRTDLVMKGHPMRVYVPFGEDWYGYATRRLRENPDLLKHYVNAILKGEAFMGR